MPKYVLLLEVFHKYWNLDTWVIIDYKILMDEHTHKNVIVAKKMTEISLNTQSKYVYLTPIRFVCPPID